MTVLFTQSWDVIPGRFDGYSEFMTNEYNPALGRMGIHLLGGYYVAVGQGPRIKAVATVEQQDYLRKILATDEYRIISAKLMNLVSAYYSKLWVSTGRLVEEPYRIQTGAWKFNRSLQRGSREGARTLSLRQRRMHPRNEGTQGANYRSMAARNRQWADNFRGVQCSQHCRHCQGH